MADNNGYGSTKNEHHLILEKFTPESLVALRTELARPCNRDISERAARESTFEGALATIGECLDIALDGVYDVAELCDVLASAMRKRHLHGSQPHLRDSRLVNVEMVERAGTVQLEEVHGDMPGVIVPRADMEATEVSEDFGVFLEEVQSNDTTINDSDTAEKMGALE